jgi:hypothetical protein
VKTSERNLLLVPKSGRINKKQRYFSLKNALKRAMFSVVESKSPMTVYDTARGVDIAEVRYAASGELRIYIDSPRRFTQLWSRV